MGVIEYLHKVTSYEHRKNFQNIIINWSFGKKLAILYDNTIKNIQDIFFEFKKEIPKKKKALPCK